MSIVSSLVGGILGSNAANNASQAEQQGANKALQTEQANQTGAQDFQNQTLANTTAAEQPYQQLGAGAANNLASTLAQGFHAPTLADAEQTPGYQFQLQQGTRAIDQNAAANGTLLSGNTGVALQNYGQGLASTAYQQDFNNALNTYQANVNPNLQAAQLGLSSTGQLAQAGQSAAQNMSNIDLTGGQQQAQQINNAAAARASGYLGSASAWSNAIGGMIGGGSDILGSIGEGLQGGGGFGDVMSSLGGLALAGG